MKATLVQVITDNSRNMKVYFCNGLTMIDDIKSQSCIITKGGICLERMTGSAYRQCGFNFIENN